MVGFLVPLNPFRLRCMQRRMIEEKPAEVEIRYLELGRLIVGTERDTIPWPREGTVGDLIKILCQRYGRDFETSILTLGGALQNHVKVEVNGVDINDLQGVETTFASSAEVKLIVAVPSLAGG